MPAPEHLPDDIAAAHKAADDLLDALDTLKGHNLPTLSAAHIRDARKQALDIWGTIRNDLPKLVQS